MQEQRPEPGLRPERGAPVVPPATGTPRALPPVTGLPASPSVLLASVGHEMGLGEQLEFALDVGLSGRLYLHLTAEHGKHGRLKRLRVMGMNLASERVATSLGLAHLAGGLIDAETWPQLFAALEAVEDGGRLLETQVSEPVSGHSFAISALRYGGQYLVTGHDLDDEAAPGRELAALRRAFEEIFDAMPVGVVRWEPVLDASGELIDLVATLNNRSACEQMGYPGSDMHGASMRRDFPGIERTGRWAPHLDVWHTGRPWHNEIGGDVEAPGNRRRLVSVVRLDDALLGTIVDVHDRWLAEQERVVAEARARALVQGSPTPVVILDAALTCLQVNDAALHLFGVDADELVGAPFEQLVRPDHAHESGVGFEALVSGEADVVQKERRVRRPDGTRRWVRVVVSAVRDPLGETHWFVAHLLDVTQERADAARLRHEATHDPLTGLPNRVLLEERLRHAQERRPRPKLPADAPDPHAGPDPYATHVAVIFIDLDGLKAINDRHGHQAGDCLLTDTARRLTLATRAHDTVARLGGDEFVVLLEDVTIGDVAAVTDRIAEILAQPYELEDGRLAEGASIGVALALPGEPVNRVLERADEAMYADKRQRKAGAEERPAGVRDERPRVKCPRGDLNPHALYGH